MRPIILNGHERPITRICFNRDGDLLFTAAKNTYANVWYSANGERLGSFSGHNGVIWWLDVDYTTNNLLTASGDYHSKLWDICTGKPLLDYEMNSPIRTCGISFCSNLLFITTDSSAGKSKNSEIVVIDKRDPNQVNQITSCVMRCTSMDKAKVTCAVWSPLDKGIICGHESGAITVVDSRSGELIKHVSAHKSQVTDIRMHLKLPMFISASKDSTAKLYSAYDLSCIRSYVTERPVNSAAISPTRDHVLLGGGQEAHEVTTTAVGQGKFDARFYHLIYQEEFGRVKGHFGPINSVSFTSDGTGFATGGEEGYVRLNYFDPDYADLD